jgi:lipoprotein-anchoring transpeptidase ErfK/SrfK
MVSRAAPTARSPRVLLAAMVALAFVAVGCSRADPERRAAVSAAPAPPPAVEPAAPPAPAPPPAPPKSLVATARVPAVQVYADPSTATPTASIANPNDYGVPVVFLVKAPLGDWLHVALPKRPNGATGWIRASDVTLTESEWRLKVELGARKLTVWKGADVVREETVAIGMARAPTPTGDFYLTELLDTGNPAGPYGPWAFGLSAYSDVYTSFAGGPGQVGLHGTNEPTKLGRDVSHGCIRVTNEAITALATELPVGSPITIVP